MQSEKKFFFKFLKPIPFVTFISVLLFHSISNAEVFSSPTLSRPSAPGTFGARSLDWSASDAGEISYHIPIQTPSLRQLDIALNIKYSPSEAYGEAGSFWGFNLPKVSLDLKRGNTKFISISTCTTSAADNLYVNGSRMIPLGNGTWASNLNSTRDRLRCEQGGFIYYKSNGEIFHFGLSAESQVSDENGKAIEWYLSKKSTFQGSQQINYTYQRPSVNSSILNFSGKTNFNLISRPLLANIMADDVSVQVNYEESKFKNPHFIGGFAQVIYGRVKEIIVQKKQETLRSYKFSYEDSSKTSFPRLSAVQEFGTDGVTSTPKTLFSYRGENSSLTESFDSINESYDYSLTPIKRGGIKFADVLGTGKTQAIMQAGYNSLWLYSYDPSKVFLGNGKGGLKNTSKNEIRFKGKTYSWASTSINNISFIDFFGTGVMDLFTSNGPSDSGPVIVFNDRKINDNGELHLERFATFSSRDLNFMRRCDNDPRNWKTMDLAGKGKSDFICLGSGYLYTLLNNGAYEVDRVDKRYEIASEKLQIPMDNFLNNAKNEDIAVVDWNADGLPDILTLLGNKVTVYMNNGRLAKGERTGTFFEKFELGVYPNLRYKKASQVTIGDFTGTGFPSISFEQKRFLINNGLGKNLTETYIKNAVHFMPEHAAVVQFTGTGKQQIIASTIADNGNAIFELSGRSFPNLLHSIVTSDGRFLSFNYSSSVLENNEAITLDNSAEIKFHEKNFPLIPVVVPVLKQAGISDGFNPLRMWRYSYRMPNYDRALKKFLGFSLVRKQTIGDNTQAGTLIEQRFLSGYRLSDSEKKMNLSQDFRLGTEKNAFTNGEPTYCLSNTQSTSDTLWCTEIAGYNYYSITGAAYDNLSFATGKINSTENYSKNKNKISLKFLEENKLEITNNNLSPKKELAQILVDSTTTEKSGEKFLSFEKIANTITNYYDDYGRLTSKIKSNSPVLNGDDLVTSYSYFCPMSHQENLKIYCDNAELIQTSSALGNVKTNAQKIIFHNLTGLPIEEWSSNQNGELILQASVIYDEYSRITQINKSTGEKSFFEWNDSNSNLKSILDQDNVKTIAHYNNLGQISKIENSRENISQFTYDTLGRILNTSKNLGGNAPLNITHIAQNSWNIFINWLKNIFGLSSTHNAPTNDNTLFDTIVSNNLIEFEKYEYIFPTVKTNNGNSIEESLLNWNQFDNNLPIIPNADSYNESTLGKFLNSSIQAGNVTIYRRNNETENLTLVSKIWLSGSDETLFSANRLDNGRFTIANKSSINSLGKVYQEYLNSEISLDNVISNRLPETSTFQTKSIYSFYANGNLATQEFDTGIIQRFNQGVDFDESISPEGRRSRNLYNQIGQIASKQMGLDANGNPSQETLTTNIEYDAFSRIIKVTNNDNLLAWQSFSANNQVEKQSNNTLGVSRFFYDNFGRLTQSALCPVGSDVENCNMLNASLLYKSYTYDTKGKLEKEEHTRFNRGNGTSAKETIAFTYGKSGQNARVQDIGLPVSVSVASLNELGSSESIHKYAYNREGVVSSEDLELFLNAPNRNQIGSHSEKKSLGVYQLERITDLAGNLVQLRSRGGFSREKLNRLSENHFTGYAAQYEDGTALIKGISFLQNGVAQSVPLQKVNYDAQGYTNKIDLENNLQLQACWHKRKEVPLAFWTGNKNTAPGELCEESAAQPTGLFHTRWNYDKDLFPISTNDHSGNSVSHASLSGNSLFTYDSQGRLSSTRGVGDVSSSWGSINYDYSVGGKINKVTRSGNFIKNRIAQNSQSLIDTYSYSNSGQIGVLESVSSTDGNETANQIFANDNIGFRKFGVAPTLAVFTPGSPSQSANTNLNSNQSNSASSWKNQSEIPMQKYVWNGRGQLAGVFAGTLPNHSNASSEIATNELLNFRMSDENGGQLAEFDGATFNEIVNSQESPSASSNGTTNRQNELIINKLPRSVSFAQGISFERDEIHFNIDLGSFATLRLITRYPTLNATDPASLSSANMQSRKELVLKDQVGSVSQVIDISTHKIVEKNASEPFGLARGIPLLSNSVLASYKDVGNRKDVSLYSNPQSNMRSNWEGKSFEILGSSNANELKGMRGTSIFATGKFSASTGFSNMGVRTLDSVRGVWLSPDLYMGRNLEGIVGSPIEGNLFQYAGNNPITNNDPTGKYLNPIYVPGSPSPSNPGFPYPSNPNPPSLPQPVIPGLGSNYPTPNNNGGPKPHQAVSPQTISPITNWFAEHPKITNSINIAHDLVGTGLTMTPLVGPVYRGVSLGVSALKTGVTNINSSVNFVKLVAKNPTILQSPSHLTAGKIREYLANIENKSIPEIVNDIKSIGLKYSEGKGGLFKHFKDANGNIRARTDPPDKMTKYDHIHIYDSKGASLNKDLQVVSPKSPSAHIKIVK
jgi:RHS repeat-associated protein